MVTQTKYAPWADPYVRNHSWLRGPPISRNGTTKTRKLTNAPTAPQTVASVNARCNFAKTDVILVVMPNARGNRREPAQRVSVRLTEMLAHARADLATQH